MYLAAGQFGQALEYAMDKRPRVTLRNTIGPGPFGSVDGGLGRRRK